MIRQTLEAITGVSIYPIFSFLLFFSFFTLMLIWVVTIQHRLWPLAAVKGQFPEQNPV